MHEDENRARHYVLIDSLTSRGPDHLSDFELLTLLFGGCVPLAEAESCAREYEQDLGPAASLEPLDFGELTWIKGIGEAKAAAIIAGVELGRRSPENTNRATAPVPPPGTRNESGSPGIFN